MTLSLDLSSSFKAINITHLVVFVLVPRFRLCDTGKYDKTEYYDIKGIRNKHFSFRRTQRGYMKKSVFDTAFYVFFFFISF